MSTEGWYPDPEGAPATLRWWDGAGWTTHTAAAGSAAAQMPPAREEPRRWWQRRRSVPEEPPLGDWRTRPGGPQSPWRDPDREYGSFWSPEPEPESDPDPDGERPEPTPWYRHSAVSGALVFTVLAAVLAAAVLTNRDSGSTSAGTDLPTSSPSAPPVARLCQGTAPSQADPHARSTPAPPGRRIVDPRAKISYAAQGPPFRAWDRGTWGSTAGSLGEQFTTGQYIITQRSTPAGGPYMLTILSGTVPAAYGDDPHPNIQCAARVIAEDVRASYYPEPNQRSGLTAQPMTISGRPAYLLQFHLAFDEPGYDAKGEQVAICVIDVPGSKAAALYVSVPDTNRQYRSLIPKLMSSIRVIR